MNRAVEIFRRRFESLADRIPAQASEGGVSNEWNQRARSADALLDRWLDGVILNNGVAVAVTGIGDGQHVLKILERFPKVGLVFCAEPNVVKFRSFLDTDNAVTLLEDERVSFGVGELGDQFYRSMADFSIMDYKDVEPLIFAPLFHGNEDYYNAFFLEFARQFDMWRKMYGTNLTKCGDWQRNSVLNLRALASSPDPISFQGAFPGVPLVMVGAGPSLDDSLGFIRSIQHQAVIVAGNSSFRALRRAGVDPHFVLAADPNPDTDRGFEGVEIGRSVLLCPFIVYPEVAKRFSGKRISAWSFGNRLAAHMRSSLGVERSAFVTEQGTVSACAFDLAVILGCPSIYFVGQDLAARTDGRMHVSDSFYADCGSDRASLEKCRWLPGNTIESVPVEEKLFVYLRTFEELSRVYSQELNINGGQGLELFNLSHYGARVEGMPYLSLENAEKQIGQNAFVEEQVSRGWAQVEAVFSRFNVGKGKLGKRLRELNAYLEALTKRSLACALRCEQAEQPLDMVHDWRSEIEQLLGADTAFREILEDGQLKYELFVHRKAMAKAKERGVDSEFREAKSYFWAIAEGSYHLMNALAEARANDLAESGR